MTFASLIALILVTTLTCACSKADDKLGSKSSPGVETEDDASPANDASASVKLATSHEPASTDGGHIEYDRDDKGRIIGGRTYEDGKQTGGWVWSTINTEKSAEPVVVNRVEPSLERPEVRIGAVSSEGNLDKNIIRRYVRRKLPRIRACYSKQLIAKPDLRGVVVATFTIQADGTVSDMSSGGVHAESDSCVASAIESLRFPKPSDGGLVKVSYSFEFSPPAGESLSAPESAPKN